MTSEGYPERSVVVWKGRENDVRGLRRTIAAFANTSAAAASAAAAKSSAKDPSTASQTLSLPPMPAELRNTVRLLAREHGLVALSEGLGVARHPVIWRSPDRAEILSRLQAFVSAPTAAASAAAAAPAAPAAPAAAASSPSTSTPRPARLDFPPMPLALEHTIAMLSADLGLYPVAEGAGGERHMVVYRAPPADADGIREQDVRRLFADIKRAATASDAAAALATASSTAAKDATTSATTAAAGPAVPAPGATSSEGSTSDSSSGESSVGPDTLSAPDIAAALQALSIPAHYGRGLLALAHRLGALDVATFHRYLVSRDREMRTVFSAFDRTHTGRVNADAVLAATRALGIEPTSRDWALVRAVLDRAKESGTEGMTYGQFRDLCSLLTPADFTSLGEPAFAAVSAGYTARAPEGAEAAAAAVAAATASAAAAGVATGAKAAAAGKSGMSVYTAVASALSGGISNAFSRTVVAPFERTRLQMAVDPTLYTGVMDCLNKIKSQEGVKGLWRGNALNVLRIAPQGAISFLTKDLVKDIMPASLKYTSLGLALASMLSGAICMSAVYPLDMVRGRVTTSPGLYSSWQQALVQIYKQGGMKALFEGVHYSNAWAVVYYGVQFYSYDSLKRMHAQYRRANGLEGPVSPAVGLAFGAVSGSLCVTAAYPLEMIRRKLQVQGLGGRPVRYAGWVDCLKQSFAEGGARGLFRGWTANMVKTPPSIALTFGAYELLMKYVFNTNVKA